MNRAFYIPLLMLFVAVPWMASASTLSIVSAPSTAGQEFSVVVRLLPEGEHLNAVEGNIQIPVGFSVSRISTGGSALTLWPVPPSFSRQGNEVTFVGGSPDGLSAEGKPLLFTLYLQAEKAGVYSLMPKDVAAYRADGAGTRISLNASPVSITIGPDPVSPENQVDTTAPNPVTAVLGHDASLFGNAPFVYFYGSDAGSGIAKYQTKEGWFAPYQDVGQYYVLADAGSNQPVWIRAIDNAGNERTVHVPGTGTLLYYGAFFVPLVLVTILALAFVRRRSI